MMGGPEEYSVEKILHSRTRNGKVEHLIKWKGFTDKEREEERKKHGEARSSLLGGGDRSERIRTYNYPQDRVTDHRCKHTTHGISKLLDAGPEDGLVPTFFPFLQNMVYDEQIAALQDED